MRESLISGAFFTLLAAALGAQAQPPGAAAPPSGGKPAAFTPGPLTVHSLSPSVHWAEGGVGNVGFVIGDKGVVVIDTTISAAGGKELVADIAKVTPKPIVAVILTHGDGDHVSGLGAFPSGIQIISQVATKKTLEAAVASGSLQIPMADLPNHTVDMKETLTLGGLKVELLHWAPAHTAGDLIAYFPAQQVVFTGDIFAFNQPRTLIHADGSSEGWLTTANAIVALPATQFVIGHGDAQDKAALKQRIDLVAGERQKIKELVAKGETLQQIQAEVGDPPAGSPPSRFPPYSEMVYKELTTKN
jgi:glyoxylase-like metal-dependent hydrolase (beta-lactamase superfamily II)